MSSRTSDWQRKKPCQCLHWWGFTFLESFYFFKFNGTYCCSKAFKRAQRLCQCILLNILINSALTLSFFYILKQFQSCQFLLADSKPFFSLKERSRGLPGGAGTKTMTIFFSPFFCLSASAALMKVKKSKEGGTW